MASIDLTFVNVAHGGSTFTELFELLPAWISGQFSHNHTGGGEGGSSLEGPGGV